MKLAVTSDDNHIDLIALMTDLGTNHGVVSVLVEGGAEVSGGMLAAGLVDRYIATIAPKLIGGAKAPGPVGGSGLADCMSNALAIGKWNIRRSGPDIVIDGLVKRGMV